MQSYRQQIGILLKRLGWLIIIYFLSRLLFIAFNGELFPAHGGSEYLKLFGGGLRFDLSAIAITNSLFILASLIPLKSFTSRAYQRFLAWLYLPVNILAVIANMSDIIYVRFTLKRTTLDFLDMFKDDAGMLALLPRFVLDFWYIVLLGLLFIFSLFWVFRRTRPKSKNTAIYSAFYFREILLILIFAALSVFAIRGGWQLRPIGIMTASSYLGADRAPAVLNTTFTLIKSAGKQKLPDHHFFTKEEVISIYNPIHKTHNKNKFRKLNVVVIIMESLSKEHIGFLNRDVKGYKGFTPFLDSLFGHGLICTQAYANGKRSIEGIPAVLAGFPNLMENTLGSSVYASNKIESIASLLKEKGYYCAFFHGGNNGTMGFDQFTESVGFDAYYGRKEYNNDKDFDGKWGIFDEPYFQYFAHKLNGLNRPFFAAVFSLSAHHPYRIPSQYKGKFREGKLPIQQCIMYSDNALRKFFATARKQPWFANTLFVITADHCSEVAMEKYNNDQGKYAIPIFYYMPADSLQGIYKNTTQQLDILPSIMDYLHYDKDYFAMGESIFDSTAFHFSISYLNYRYQLIHGNEILQSDLKTYFNYEHFDAGIRTDTGPGRMRNFLKAVVQTYNYRMNHNQMYK